MKIKYDKIHQKIANQSNEEEKQIYNIIKSFYFDHQNFTNLIRRVQNDIDLSIKVRNIFKDEENNEVILQMIESKMVNYNNRSS